MTKGSFQDNYGKGTQHLVCHLAHKYPRPNTEHQMQYYGENRLYATTNYILIYIPEDSIDGDMVAVDAGYSGSSKDHYY